VSTRAKKLTDAERIATPCPKCCAVAGERCFDRDAMMAGGTPKLCQERGRPHITAAKLQRKAAELNAKARAGYGPLFASVADAELTPVTPADIQANRLRGLRLAVENNGLAEEEAKQGLNQIAIAHLRRVAALLIGVGQEADVWECASRRYGRNWNYVVDMYRRALCTTQPETLAMELRFDPARVNATNREGRYVVPSKTWPPAGYTPVMTQDEFTERFGLRGHFWTSPKDLPEPDDGGLFESTIGQLRKVK
jgi:hypothetical protein